MLGLFLINERQMHYKEVFSFIIHHQNTLLQHFFLHPVSFYLFCMHDIGMA